MRDRDSARLFSHNYAWKSLYFVTINTYSKDHIFGEISHGSMILNEFGEIARKEWIKTEYIRRNIEIDEFIIMPDHIHGLIRIKYEVMNNHKTLPENKNRNVLPEDGKGVLHWDSRGVLQYAPTIQTCSFSRSTIDTDNFRSPSNTLGAVIRGYKGAVTKQINTIRQTYGYPVWQRNYYDRIIRTEKELKAVRKYIRNNPKKWADNKYGK